jgi:hypothetical protein
MGGKLHPFIHVHHFFERFAPPADALCAAAVVVEEEPFFFYSCHSRYFLNWFMDMLSVVALVCLPPAGMGMAAPPLLAALLFPMAAEPGFAALPGFPFEALPPAVPF